MKGQGFSLDAFKYYNMYAAETVSYIKSYRQEKNNLSFFGRAEYVFNNKYILNASYRADGASNFGSGNKWGYFPSVSAGWQLGDEPWMSWTKPVMNSLKLRASWGRTGNDGIGLYKSLKTFASGKAYVGSETAEVAIYPSNAGNTGLKWETTTQSDFGFDAAFFNNRLEVTFDVYSKITTDLLNDITISYTGLGLATATANDGCVSNKGVEFYLKGHVIDKKDFFWDTNFSFGYNKNKVEELGYTAYTTVVPQGGHQSEQLIRLTEGDAMGSLYAYRWIGIIQEGEEYAPQPKSQPGDPKFADLDGDGVITTADREVCGVGVPPVQMGWGNTFRFKDFDLSFFFDAALGGSIYNINTFILEDNDRLKTSGERWTKANPSTTMQRSDCVLQYGGYVNDHYIESSDFLRLSNLEIGYNLPCKKLGLNFMKGLRIYVGGQRLFTLTKYTGFDPELNSWGTSDVNQGLDFCAYPSYRSYNCGAKITF